MKEIQNAKLLMNEKGILVDVNVSMNADDGDGLYIVHFAAVQDEDDSNLRFSVLATTNLSEAKSEEDLVENTEEIWSIPFSQMKMLVYHLCDNSKKVGYLSNPYPSISSVLVCHRWQN